jgi:hypothetical protein
LSVYFIEILVVRIALVRFSEETTMINLLTLLLRATRPASAMIVLLLLGTVQTHAAESWKSVGWGGGGLYWAAAFHPTNPDVIYMGGDVAGIYKTEDAGKHWRLINNGLSNYAIYSLAISPSNPETLYAGTTSGLCKTTNGGKRGFLLPRQGANS